jgi:hypothetical protein
MNGPAWESEAPRNDLQLILQKQTMIQWLEASFRCMERETRGSDC